MPRLTAAERLRLEELRPVNVSANQWAVSKREDGTAQVYATGLGPCRELKRLEGLLVEFGAVHLELEKGHPHDPNDTLIEQHASAYERIKDEACRLAAARQAGEGRE